MTDILSFPDQPTPGKYWGIVGRLSNVWFIRFVVASTPERFVAFIERTKTKNPRTYNEKILYKMAHDRRPILTLFADKLRVRDFVAAQVGESVLTTLYASSSDARLIDWTVLPREFVAKVNHGSGGVVVVSTAADPAHRLPASLKKLSWSRFFIHPDSVDYDILANMLNAWLKMPYGQQKLFTMREWAYANIERRILVEQYVGTHTTMPRQILVVCFHGRPTELTYYRGYKTFTQDSPLKILDDEIGTAGEALNIPPHEWEEMLRMSEILSSHVDMVRVDWLITDRGFVFNELTNYPAAGLRTSRGSARHSPQELDQLLGDLWTIPGV